jgi:hypothetical protein
VHPKKGRGRVLELKVRRVAVDLLGGAVMIIGAIDIPHQLTEWSQLLQEHDVAVRWGVVVVGLLIVFLNRRRGHAPQVQSTAADPAAAVPSAVPPAVATPPAPPPPTRRGPIGIVLGGGGHLKMSGGGFYGDFQPAILTGDNAKVSTDGTEFVGQGMSPPVRLTPPRSPERRGKQSSPPAGPVSRNKPCPCGSRKKYKNCHGKAA